MSKVIALLFVICVAGCAAGSAATKSSGSRHKKPAMCSLYIGGYGACIGNCSGARVHASSAAACTETCTPGGPNEPPSCQRQPGCEAMQEAQGAAAYAACTSQCDAMPIECR